MFSTRNSSNMSTTQARAEEAERGSGARRTSKPTHKCLIGIRKHHHQHEQHKQYESCRNTQQTNSTTSTSGTTSSGMSSCTSNTSSTYSTRSTRSTASKSNVNQYKQHEHATIGPHMTCTPKAGTTGRC